MQTFINYVALGNVSVARGQRSIVNGSVCAIYSYTRTVQPVATCRQSPYVRKPAIVKLLLFIYGLNSDLLFYTMCVSITPTTPSWPRPLPSLTH